MAYVKKFQIPSHEVDPSDEMIEWLHGLKQEWDGDDSGVTVCIGVQDGEQVWATGGPGDWLIQDEETGLVSIGLKQWVEENLS
jgi:hypothetical protein